MIHLNTPEGKKLHKEFKAHVKKIYKRNRMIGPHIKKLMEEDLNK